MKRNTTSKPSIGPEQMAAALAAAPERADDPDCRYDPKDPAAVAEHWKDSITGQSLAELRGTLTARRRGPGRAPAKVSTTIRLDADVLAALKATGPGWQTRINDAMRAYVETLR
ncbi:BrnA antitoxin family protein [uncultured Thiodictyon sp.]|nr:BrnA antitoxin family protein [uncultured Thiodictyon sp.]